MAFADLSAKVLAIAGNLVVHQVATAQAEVDVGLQVGELLGLRKNDVGSRHAPRQQVQGLHLFHFRQHGAGSAGDHKAATDFVHFQQFQAFGLNPHSGQHGTFHIADGIHQSVVVGLAQSPFLGLGSIDHQFSAPSQDGIVGLESATLDGAAHQQPVVFGKGIQVAPKVVKEQFGHFAFVAVEVLLGRGLLAGGVGLSHHGPRIQAGHLELAAAGRLLSLEISRGQSFGVDHQFAFKIGIVLRTHAQLQAGARLQNPTRLAHQRHRAGHFVDRVAYQTTVILDAKNSLLIGLESSVYHGRARGNGQRSGGQSGRLLLALFVPRGRFFGRLAVLRTHLFARDIRQLEGGQVLLGGGESGVGGSGGIARRGLRPAGTVQHSP